MQLKIPILAVVLFLLAVLPASLVNRVYAVPGPAGGVDDPSNIWAPYGPYVQRLQFQYYPGDTKEFEALDLGQIDLTDTPVPAAKFGFYDAHQYVVQSVTAGSTGYRGIQYNHAASTWTNWGCSFDFGNSDCGIQIRKAFAHLVDRERFALDLSGGSASALIDPVAPVKDPKQSSSATRASWDTDINGNILHVSTVDSAFNIVFDTGGFPAPSSSSPDFCAARDHMISAFSNTPGHQLQDLNNDCVIDSASPGYAAIVSNKIRFLIRNEAGDLRFDLGQGLANGMDALFGTSITNRITGDIVQLLPIIRAPPTTPVDDYDIYTFGFGTGSGALQDHLTFFYHSFFASNLCGGPIFANTFNSGFVCIPEFDVPGDAADAAVTIPQYTAETFEALDVLGDHAAQMPVFSLGTKTAALRDIAGLLDVKGTGYGGGSILNARDALGDPADLTFRFGGGDPTTIRWGQKGGTEHINPYQAQSLWDQQLTFQMYDTLTGLSPIEQIKVYSGAASSFQDSIDGSGNMHILYDLRRNMLFQDGVPVTAQDVKFSILSYRDLPGCCIDLSPVADVVVHDPFTVEVIMDGTGLAFLSRVGGVPIIPKHIWDTNGDGLVDAAKAATTYDALSNGDLIGSGPWMCMSVFGDVPALGRGCAQNADGSRATQNIPAVNGRALLVRYNRVAELGNSNAQYWSSHNPDWSGADLYGGYPQWSYADKDDDAHVSILDLTSVAQCAGRTSGTGASGTCPDLTFAYWNAPGIAAAGIDTEPQFVQNLFDQFWVFPFSWNNIDLLNIIAFSSLGT